MENFINGFINFGFDLLTKIQMPMSVAQIIVILGFFGICAYIGQFKVGLVVSFFTVTYWAYSSNESWILETATGSSYGMLAAITTGMAVAFVGFVGIFQEKS
jgi:amino acid transporter